MSNEKHYPLHPNATHPPIMTCEIPLEEYESLKRENERLTIDKRNAELRADVADATIAELKAKLETVNDLVKSSRKFLDDAMKSPTFEKDKEIERLKESVKFFSDTLHREEESAKKCFKDLMDDGLISGWGLTKNFFVMPKYTKEHIVKFEKQEAEIESLKAKLESVQATAYAESVDAGMENRKLKRALWLARAERAKEMCRRLLIQGFDPKWEEVERKCRAKAEQYK